MASVSHTTPRPRETKPRGKSKEARKKKKREDYLSKARTLGGVAQPFSSESLSPFRNWLEEAEFALRYKFSKSRYC